MGPIFKLNGLSINSLEIEKVYEETSNTCNPSRAHFSGEMGFKTAISTKNKTNIFNKLDGTRNAVSIRNDNSFRTVTTLTKNKTNIIDMDRFVARVQRDIRNNDDLQLRYDGIVSSPGTLALHRIDETLPTGYFRTYNHDEQSAAERAGTYATYSPGLPTKQFYKLIPKTKQRIKIKGFGEKNNFNRGESSPRLNFIKLQNKIRNTCLNANKSASNPDFFSHVLIENYNSHDDINEVEPPMVASTSVGASISKW